MARAASRQTGLSCQRTRPVLPHVETAITRSGIPCQTNKVLASSTMSRGCLASWALLLLLATAQASTLRSLQAAKSQAKAPAMVSAEGDLRRPTWAIAEGEIVGTAPDAPEPSAAESFAGKPLVRAQNPKKHAAGELPFPVNEVHELSDLTEKQLWTIFQEGVADIPSALPSEKGKFVICPTDIVMADSYTRPEALPQGGLPGVSDIFNSFNRLWNGKAWYTDPITGNTNIWNLMLTNSTVDVIGTASVRKGGQSKDHRDSVMINYRKSDAVVLRPMLDELRRVGPTVWLGRMWLDNLVEAYKPSYVAPAAAPLVNDVIAPLANATLKATLGLAGQPILQPDVPLGDPVSTVYFAVECVDQPVPPLQYVPYVANAITSAGKATGYEPENFTLPTIPNDSKSAAKSEGSAASAEVASAPGPGGATASITVTTWPLATLANQTVVVPSSVLAPMFGSTWARDDATAAASPSAIPGLRQVAAVYNGVYDAVTSGALRANAAVTDTLSTIASSGAQGPYKVDYEGRPIINGQVTPEISPDDVAKQSSAKKIISGPAVEGR